MALSPSRLTPLQAELIERFFEDEDEFWLTGGAALAGYHLGHRATHDIDLFGPADADLIDAARRIEAIAEDLGATVERLRTFPTFVRMLVSRAEDKCEVDLVRESVSRTAPVELHGRVRLDSLRELAANKLACLVSRTEVRDLVDLEHLAAKGVDLDQAFADAQAKDAGLSPDTLAMSISWIPVEQATELIADESIDDLTTFRDELVRRFRRLAFPGH